MNTLRYPVIDLFAGPGGLGEGFSTFRDGSDADPFKVVLSVEKERSARETLKIRSFYRLMKEHGLSLDSYYHWLNYGEGSYDPITSKEQAVMDKADAHARLHELGSDEVSDRKLERDIAQSIHHASLHEYPILIGGPPCQAYSLVGRARNKGNCDYRAEDDHRHFLYKEYLRIVDLVSPAVFVMENVRGILSSKVDGRRIFPDILSDLISPYQAMGKTEGSDYEIHSLICGTVCRDRDDAENVIGSDFLIKSEDYGVPQRRHRVILLGIRKDLVDRGVVPGKLVTQAERVNVGDVISDLPMLRSRLSKGGDSDERWLEKVEKATATLSRGLTGTSKDDIAFEIEKSACLNVRSTLDHGALRCPVMKENRSKTDLSEWYLDHGLVKVLNHETRGHIYNDLKRYLYVSAFGVSRNVSPKASDFPAMLAPNHSNWNSGKFADRFRVQLDSAPSTTITSHISKDGHYFIHPDPVQCRSFTVREAARLQTFPDNYIFMGNRTEQYVQVGNAVPPLLAYQIAEVVHELLAQDQ